MIMSMELALVALLLSAVVCIVQGYSGGAPPNVCDSMFPGHSGVRPKNTASPYSISFSQTTYSPGAVISGTLSGSGRQFMGFLITAKTPDNKLVGEFIETSAGRSIGCNFQNRKTGLTHTAGFGQSLLRFKWKAPLESVGAITFYATVVQDYTTFWMSIRSTLTFELPTTIPPTEATTTTTTMPTTVKTTTTRETTVVTEETKQTLQTTKAVVQSTQEVTTQKTSKSTTVKPSTGELTLDKSCGVTRGCFTQCKADSCDFIILWKDNVEYVEFDIRAKLSSEANKWIAIALSHDSKMGDDDVVECILVENVVKVQRSKNVGYRNIPENEPNTGLSDESGSFVNGIFSCKFRWSKHSFVRAKREVSHGMNLEDDFYLMFGYGTALPGFRKRKHYEIPLVTASKVDFQSINTIGDVADKPLIKVHGILMLIAWIFFAGVGVISARYFKPVWSSKSLFGQKVWFQIHRFSMVTALVLTLVGFIVIFIEVQGYSHVSHVHGQEHLQAHPPLGIIVTALAIINPIMSIFRPGPKDINRPIFNWCHWGVGMLAHILAMITMCLGVQMKKSTSPRLTVWVIVGYILYHLVIEVILKSIDLYVDVKHKGKEPVEAVDMTQINGSTVQNGNKPAIPPPAYTPTEEQKDPKDNIVKKLLLGFHLLFAMAFTITLILLVALY